MRKFLPLLYICLLCTMLLGLISCASTSQQNTVDLSQSAKNYLEQAAAAQGDQEHLYQLLALNQLLKDNNLNDSQQLLQHLNAEKLNDINYQYKLILASQLLLQENQPRQAAQALRQINNLKNLPSDIQETYFQTSAESHLRNNDVAGCALAQMSLNNFLTDPDEKSQNEKEIWKNLQSLSLSQLQTLFNNSQSNLLRGWLQLAIINKQNTNQPTKLVNQIQWWQKNYPNHDAQNILPDSDQLNAVKNSHPPSQIALLLPLHGPYADMGRAVRDGFMTAFYNNAKYLPQTPNIKIYDTDQNDVVALYEQAINEGAQFVIGPLTKDNVNQIAQSADISVPTLVLNYLDNDESVPNHLIQFGLSPAQSAKQIAELAWRYEGNDFLTISADSDWSNNIQMAFVTKLQEFNGQTITTLNFSDTKQLSEKVTAALNIDESNARAEKITELLNEKIKSMPRRRQDIHGIFLIATPDQARQIVPLLKFYFAGNLPIFSISNIYSGYPSASNDHDLNGIYFNDMPLLLSNQNEASRAKLEKLWPTNYRVNNRLYGLGMDAYTISILSTRFINLPNFPIDGLTGLLYLDSHGQIYRGLSDAQFREGIPYPLSS